MSCPRYVRNRNGGRGVSGLARSAAFEIVQRRAHRRGGRASRTICARSAPARRDMRGSSWRMGQWAAVWQKATDKTTKTSRCVGGRTWRAQRQQRTLRRWRPSVGRCRKAARRPRAAWDQKRLHIKCVSRHSVAVTRATCIVASGRTPLMMARRATAFKFCSEMRGRLVELPHPQAGQAGWSRAKLQPHCTTSILP